MVGRSNKVLFIEGTSDDGNGDLRLGFSKLLSQRLSGKMPRIIMGNGVSEVIDKFKNASYTFKAALIDLDGKGSNVGQGNYEPFKVLKREFHKLNSNDFVCFMVQKMEAWFLSQPEILKERFKINFNNIPYNHPSKIESPDKVLFDMTNQLKSKSYHKVRDGSKLLEKLDLFKLESMFADVRELIQNLS